MNQARPRPSPESVFRSLAFTRFWFAQGLSALGDGVSGTALPLLVFRLTGSAELLGFALAAGLLPLGVVGLVGGALADGFDRRSIMLAADLFRAAVLVALAVAVARNSLGVVAICLGMFALSAASALFNGAESAAVPFMVGKARAKAAYSALGTTTRSISILAQPLGAAILGIAGPVAALVANAASYGASFAAIGSIRSCGPQRTGAVDLTAVPRGIRDGARFVRSDGTLAGLSLASCAFWFVGSVADTARIPLLKGPLHASDFAAGLFFGAVALGVVVGMAVAGVTRWPFGPAVVVAYALQGFGDFLGSQSPSLVAVTAAFALGGAAYGYIVVSRTAWMARISPADKVGSVYGATTFLSMAGAFAGTVLAGPVTAALGPRVAIAAATAAFIGVALVLACIPSVRSERR